MNEALRIEILGTGCKKCRQLETNARQAVAMRNLTAEIVHITDIMQIMYRGVMAKPALVVNDEVMSQGEVKTPEQIAAHLG